MPAKPRTALALVAAAVLGLSSAVAWRHLAVPAPLPVFVTGRLLVPSPPPAQHDAHRVVVCFNYQTTTQRLHVDDAGRFRVRVDYPYLDDARRSVRFQLADQHGHLRYGAEVDLSFDFSGTRDVGDVALAPLRAAKREPRERRPPTGVLHVQVQPAQIAPRLLFEITCRPVQRAAVLESRHELSDSAAWQGTFPAGRADLAVWDGARLLTTVRDIMVPNGDVSDDARLQPLDLTEHYERTTIRNAHSDASMLRRMRVSFRAADSDRWCNAERTDETTFAGYSLSGHGDVLVDGRGLRTRIYRDVPREFVVDWQGALELAIALGAWPHDEPVERLSERWTPVLDPPPGVTAHADVQYAHDLGLYLAWPTAPGRWTLRWEPVELGSSATRPASLRGSRTLDVLDTADTQLVRVPF